AALQVKIIMGGAGGHAVAGALFEQGEHLAGDKLAEDLRGAPAALAVHQHARDAAMRPLDHLHRVAALARGVLVGLADGDLDVEQGRGPQPRAKRACRKRMLRGKISAAFQALNGGGMVRAAASSSVLPPPTDSEAMRVRVVMYWRSRPTSSVVPTGPWP